MKRRELLQVAGAAAMASFATKGLTADAVTEGGVSRKTSLSRSGSPHVDKSLLWDKRFFLSTINPVANVDQRDMEALALDVLQMPAVAKGKELMAIRWKTIAGRDIGAEAWARFDKISALEEPFNYVLKAVNLDANYPKVLGAIYDPPHEWFGMKIPGSRAGGCDGPDTSYSIIPIDAHARFELHGRRFHPTVADGSYWLIGNISLSMLLNHVQRSDIPVDADGGFVVTIGPEPANGRVNHLQTEPEVRFLIIRNTRNDWHQIPDAHRIRRVDPPTAPALEMEQIAKNAARFMLDDVAQYVMWANYFNALDINTISVSGTTSAIGGMSTQSNAMARLRIENDEAFVLTVAGGMRYRGVALFDYWCDSLDYWNRSASMNYSQCEENPDGSTTFVISIEDPGIYNWLDPSGYHEPRLLVRFQNPRWMADNMPWAKGQLVKLKNLDSLLPPGTKRVDATERRQQLVERLDGFKRRYVDS